MSPGKPSQDCLWLQFWLADGNQGNPQLFWKAGERPQPAEERFR
jgi:hypothetical protein